MYLTLELTKGYWEHTHITKEDRMKSPGVWFLLKDDI